jgi:hypothetical protein
MRRTTTIQDEEEFEYDTFSDAEILETNHDLPPGPTEGWSYPYKPYPKQKLAHSYDVDEILFGGAAGPGKLIGHWQSV